MKSLKKVVSQLTEFTEYLDKLQDNVITPLQEICKKNELPINIEIEIDWEYSPQESVVAIILGEMTEKKVNIIKKELEAFVEKDIFEEYFSYLDEDDDDEESDLDEIEFEDVEEELKEMEEELEEMKDEIEEDEVENIEIIFDAGVSFADNPLIITLGKVEDIFKIFVEFEYKLEI